MVSPVDGDGRYLIDERAFEPAYMAAYRSGRLQQQIEGALAQYRCCDVCPRNCKVDRMGDKKWFCRTGRYPLVGSYFPHFGEEDCLRGWNGSGTIFFSLCNLRCQFCFHPDTRIATNRGLTRIADLFSLAESVVTNDHGEIGFLNGLVSAFTRTGQAAPVTKVFRHHFAGELVVLKPYNCPPLLLTSDHQVFATRKKQPGQVVKVRADELTKDHYLIVPKRKPARMELELPVAEQLQQDIGRFRRSLVRRVPTKQLVACFSQPVTSDVLAELTGYHPVYARKLRAQWRKNELLPEEGREWVDNEIIIEDGYIRFKTERRPGIPCRLRLNEELAWLLGIYCAEGHVTSQRNRPNSHLLVISFGHLESETAARTADLLQRLFKVQPKMRKRRTTITVEVGKASLGLLFSRLCGHGAHDKQIPPLLSQAKASVLQAYLQGVLDGDGYDSGTHLVINTVSEKFALGLYEIGILLGALPSFHRWLPAPTKLIEGREVNQAPLYYVKIPKVDPQTGRRHTHRIETADCFLLPLHHIERLPYSGPVYNLEVDDPDHSYLAPFLAVSNCQNWDISYVGNGEEILPEQLAGMMIELQDRGCHNINFVTPEHVVPNVLEALPYAIERGLRLPIVYNTSAYDSLTSLSHLDGVVDIYMPDFKYWHPEMARRYVQAEDYPERARQAIREMYRQVGPLRFGSDGLARRGLLIRHLVMPGETAGTREIMQWISQELSRDTYVNVMDQYRPEHRINEQRFPEINRRTTSREYQDAVCMAQEAGLWRLDQRRPHRLLMNRIRY